MPQLRVIIVFCFTILHSFNALSSPHPTLPNSNLESAYFAGGCYWCLEAAFEDKKGVYTVTTGYSGDLKSKAQMSSLDIKESGALVAIEIKYNPAVVHYKDLLNIYWRNIDPTKQARQFEDIGEEYKTAILYLNARQKRMALQSKKTIEKSNRFDGPIVTQIVEFKAFHPATRSNQDYRKKNPLRYQIHLKNSGRNAFKRRHWDNNSINSNTKNLGFPPPSQEALKLVVPSKLK